MSIERRTPSSEEAAVFTRNRSAYETLSDLLLSLLSCFPCRRSPAGGVGIPGAPQAGLYRIPGQLPQGVPTSCASAGRLSAPRLRYPCPNAGNPTSRYETPGCALCADAGQDALRQGGRPARAGSGDARCARDCGTPVLPGKPAAGKGAGMVCSRAETRRGDGRRGSGGGRFASLARSTARAVPYRWLRTPLQPPRCRRTAWPMPGKAFREVHTMPWRRVRGAEKALGLNDWGYYDLVRTLADGFCGPKTNESVVLQSFLMAEAGYKCAWRAATAGCSCCWPPTAGLCPSLFQYHGQVFYILDDARGPRRTISAISRSRGAAFVAGDTCAALFAQKPRRPPSAISVCVVSTTDGKPQPDGFLYELSALLEHHAATAPPPGARQLYPRCAPQWPEGRTRGSGTAAALPAQAFLQRPTKRSSASSEHSSPRRNYYYPYSDCEDRSILFARLVKDLLGLDVVLLYYPAHIATAVCFKGEVKATTCRHRQQTLCNLRCDLYRCRRGRGDARPEAYAGPSRPID